MARNPSLIHSVVILTVVFTVTTCFTLEANIRKGDIHLASNANTDTSTVQPIDTFFVGDINDDGKKDTAFSIPPRFINPEDIFEGCTDNLCHTTIRFSCAVDSIYDRNNIGGSVFDAGDLNEDGHAEIIVLPAWFQSCWGRISVYSYLDNHWKEAGKTTIYWCLDEDYTQRVIKKDRYSFAILGDELDDNGDRIQSERLFKF